MIDSVTRITLNLQDTNTLVCVQAKRGDTGRKLLIHLADGSIPYPIAPDCYAVFTARKSDGTKLHHPCEIENNVIIYTFTEQTCAAVGALHCEIKLYGSDRRLITSGCFLLNVADTVYREGDEVSSKGEMTTLDALICDASALISQLEQNSGISAVTDSLNDRKKKNTFAMVSFMDDDCREEVFTKLFPVIQSKGIPYTLACAPYDIGRVTDEYRFLRLADELLPMYKAGVKIACHHYKQQNMDTFATEADYRADLQACRDAFDRMGIHNVDTICYPQGVVVDDYLKTIKEFNRMGFTVTRGINQIPFETYHMKRCEVFSTHGLWTQEDAKKYVDRLELEGGWLIFMTHAWYSSFDPAALGDLIDYIVGKGIPIVDIPTAIKAKGNIIEAGRFRKPVEEMYEPFFVVDASGAVWANCVNTVAPSTVKVEILNVKYHTATYIKPSGGLSSHNDVKRCVTVDIPAAPGERYRITGSAVWGGAIYAVYNQDGGVEDIRTGANTENGECLIDHEITMPANTAYFRVSFNQTKYPDQFAVKKLTGIS